MPCPRNGTSHCLGLWPTISDLWTPSRKKNGCSKRLPMSGKFCFLNTIRVPNAAPSIGMKKVELCCSKRGLCKTCSPHLERASARTNQSVHNIRKTRSMFVLQIRKLPYSTLTLFEYFTFLKDIWQTEKAFLEWFLDLACASLQQFRVKLSASLALFAASFNP